MAEGNPEVWEYTIGGVKYHGAYGSKDVLIIVSSESLEGPNIVPRKKGELTGEDMGRLESQGIPQESWHDDARLMKARYKKDDKRVNEVIVPSPAPRKHILDKITSLFKNTTQPGGMSDIVSYLYMYEYTLKTHVNRDSLYIFLVCKHGY